MGSRVRWAWQYKLGPQNSKYVQIVDTYTGRRVNCSLLQRENVLRAFRQVSALGYYDPTRYTPYEQKKIEEMFQDHDTWKKVRQRVLLRLGRKNVTNHCRRIITLETVNTYLQNIQSQIHLIKGDGNNG